MIKFRINALIVSINMFKMKQLKIYFMISTKLYFKKSCEKKFQNINLFIYFAIFFFNLFSNCFASKNKKILYFIYYYMLMNKYEIVENEFQKIFYEYSYQYILVITFFIFFCCWKISLKHKFVYLFRNIFFKLIFQFFRI